LFSIPDAFSRLHDAWDTPPWETTPGCPGAVWRQYKKAGEQGQRKKGPLVRKDPGPSVLFAEFGADSLDFALRVFVGLADMTAVQNQLRLSIQEEFTKAGLEIPFAQRDVHLDTSAPLEVRMIEAS
jgi:small-conductance mechanosensitive channel